MLGFHKKLATLISAGKLFHTLYMKKISRYILHQLLFSNIYLVGNCRLDKFVHIQQHLHILWIIMFSTECDGTSETFTATESEGDANFDSDSTKAKAVIIQI